MVCNCGSPMSMSAQNGGMTWWRCIQCGQFQSTNPSQPPRRKPARAVPVPARSVEVSALAPVTATPAPIEGAPAETDGCAVCSSPDVTYALSTDVTGALIRVGFCSIECLAQKLGLVRKGPPSAPGEPVHMTGT